jgi:two-component system, NtrC family, response regulator HydG
LGMTPEAIEKITAYEWPGNVRELRNAIEYAFVLCSSGGIGVDHLPPKIINTLPQCVEPDKESQPIGKKDNPAKRAALIKALRQARGNRSETARLLGVSRVTVWKQIKRFKIDLLKDLA